MTELTTNIEQTPVTLIAKAIDQGASIETIERLVALEEKWRAGKAKEAYAHDFVKMKPELPRVIRTKSNKQTNSKYAALEDVNQVVDPILSKYGFATAMKIVAQTPESVTIEAELWHDKGHVERTSILLPLDDKGMQGAVNKTKIHATSSTVSYGRRIALCALLNISTGDDDDGQQPKTVAKAETQDLPDDVGLEVSISETNAQLVALWNKYPKAQFPQYHKDNMLESKIKETRTRIYNGYKKKITEALNVYTGADKITLRTECAQRVRENKFDEEFAFGIAKKINLNLP